MKKLLLLVLFMMAHLLMYASSFGVSPSSNDPSKKTTESKHVSHKSNKSVKKKILHTFKRKQIKTKLDKISSLEKKGPNWENITDEAYLFFGLLLLASISAILLGFVINLLWLIILGFSLFLIWLILVYLALVVFKIDGPPMKWF